MKTEEKKLAKVKRYTGSLQKASSQGERQRVPTKRDAGAQVFNFHVTLDIKESPMMSIRTANQRIAKVGTPKRDIAIQSDSSLYQLAKAVLDSFGFDCDHCFGFFSTDFKQPLYQDAKRQYELFTDIPEVEPTGAGSVEQTMIKEVWSKVGDKMAMLFDYGDMWWFTVELQSIEKSQKDKKYPYLTAKSGKSPQQY